MGKGDRASGALVYRLLETILLALFYTARTLSAPSGHLPLEGKAIPARGEAATFIPYSSKAFIPNQGAARPRG